MWLARGYVGSSATSPELGRELSRAVWLLWDRGACIHYRGKYVLMLGDGSAGPGMMPTKKMFSLLLIVEGLANT